MHREQVAWNLLQKAGARVLQEYSHAHHPVVPFLQFED